MRQSASKKSNSAKSPEPDDSNSRQNLSGSSTSSNKGRKRKRCEILTISDFESEFEDCDLEDAVALETRLRKVARKNSLSHEEMMKLLHKFVKNEHILALITLKAEDELAREKLEAEQRAIIITDTPSIPKLTRSKAKELKKQPTISLPKILSAEQTEIASLINEELNSDEEDEEYTFKEEDFVSDDDPNTTASDLDSNPRTPQTPAVQAEADDSPVKLSEDGCFKVPLNKKGPQEELRIATRTRSKLCLQQTTIEDIESEFIPPDVDYTEPTEPDSQAIDEDWNQFLNDFLKPLNSSLVGDDDDPINDPEYVAAEKELVDAEELRDVNISKKEIAELMTELLSNLNEGISFESIELETPRKFLLNYQDDQLNTPNRSPEKNDENVDSVSRQLQFEEQPSNHVQQQTQTHESVQESCSITSSNNITQQNISFHPDVMSTPSTTHNVQNNEVQAPENDEAVTMIPVATPKKNADNSLTSTVCIPSNNVNTQVDIIAVPIPGQPNCFQLAKVVNSPEELKNGQKVLTGLKYLEEQYKGKAVNIKYNVPYETNYCGEYISIKRHALAEYIDKFESLKHAQVNQISSTTTEPEASDKEFTKYQYDLMQQQMRIHVQMLTQTYIQTYCHPELWKLASKPKEMLLELQKKSKENANFKIWNLEKAINLINKWAHELDEDNEENRALMQFLHREVELTNHNTRQIPRFHPRLLECFLESDVFMYPEYLPRMPFTPKVISLETFSPVETYLIAMGLEKHVNLILQKNEKIGRNSTPERMACKRLTKDILQGKNHRRVWPYIMQMKEAEYYNPIKYYFEHKRAPPVEHTPIVGFANNTVPLPKDRFSELPLVFQQYLQKKNAPPPPPKPPRRKSIVKNPKVKASDKFRDSFLEFVREAVGEDLPIEQSIVEEPSSQPSDSQTLSGNNTSNTPLTTKRNSTETDAPKPKRKRLPRSLTINVNYVFGSPPATNLPAILPNNTSNIGNLNNTSLISNSSFDSTYGNKNLNRSSNSAVDTPVITYNFDLATKTLQPQYNQLTTTFSQQSYSLGRSTLNTTVADTITICSDDSVQDLDDVVNTTTVSEVNEGQNTVSTTAAQETSTTTVTSSVEPVRYAATADIEKSPVVSSNTENCTSTITTSVAQKKSASSATQAVRKTNSPHKGPERLVRASTVEESPLTVVEPSKSATPTSDNSHTSSKRTGNAEGRISTVKEVPEQSTKLPTPSKAPQTSTNKISSSVPQSVTSVSSVLNPVTNKTVTPDTTHEPSQQKSQRTASNNCQQKPTEIVDGNKENCRNTSKIKQQLVKQRRRTVILSHITKLNKNITRKSVAYREKRSIKQRCEDLITAYGLHLETLQVRYKHSPKVQHVYRRFKALELYTNLLKGLKMICNKSASNNNSGGNSNSSPSGLKRSRNSHAEDESSPSSQRMARKINRQEENFRHMLLPDTPEETNRKDAIYAFNFYEKVEEAFRASNRPDDCKKFNTILKTFDPKKDKVSDLYYKLEKLFLPDHPELAQVFLTFLLPSEAAEIGKFFEHFMITNMTTFINKLNIYFNKQPAQIRKIYNCLNELADDPDVTMKKIESKIIPLLKGNQFLIDWFMQQFPKSTPPERLFSTPEHILNVKEQQTNRSGEHVETITDLDNTTNDVQSQTPTCQLRYINGRIFYGSKMLLPAKLSFMAASYKDNIRTNAQPTTQITGCVHAIKDHGEKRLQSSSELANAATNTESTDEQDKSEEEDVSKVLVIDTTAEEDDSCSSFEPCDENTLKAHALRLNPSYYGSTCYSASATSTPNLNSNFQSHHPNAKKTSLNFSEDATSGSNTTAAGKTSPRKNQTHNSINSPSTTTTTSCQSHANAREKRKSPSKKTKSPLIHNTGGRSVRSFSNQPMVVIHENNSAIQCAKRLKTLVEVSSDEQNTGEDTVVDTKEHIQIVARTKTSMKTSTCVASSSAAVTSTTHNNASVKQEQSDDLEFLPEHASVTRSPFPSLKMDTDSNEEDAAPIRNTPYKVGSDEDCKIDIVANLVTEPSSSRNKSNETPRPSVPLPLNAAWTRDEDKVILIEMKLGSTNREELYQRIATKLPRRTLFEIKARHQFLVDFLAKLQGK
ncbi:gon-4 like protein muscle wasted [Musca autumnalis]|uniref:gon-4 like protein muscle wasted n=1 Tax=Musca autumnalis TaxID=221902 RepID=UPI003CFB23E5